MAPAGGGEGGGSEQKQLPALPWTGVSTRGRRAASPSSLLVGSVGRQKMGGAELCLDGGLRVNPPPPQPSIHPWLPAHSSTGSVVRHFLLPAAAIHSGCSGGCNAAKVGRMLLVCVCARACVCVWRAELCVCV